jgi:tyrosine-protein phosphatase 2/3
MLHSASARARFSDWRSSTQILVYDVDATAIPEGSNILGLLRKFAADGFQGPLLWLHGGFQAVWKENRPLIVTTPPTPEVDDEAGTTTTTTTTGAPSSTASRGSRFGGAMQTMSLRTDRLPTDAFSTVSTMSTGTGSAGAGRSQARAFNPFYDSVRQNVELSQGITERIPLKLPARVRRRAHELPFPWLRTLAHRADMIPPNEESESEGSDIEPSDIDNANVEEGKEAFAMQFYRIELAEQRRMMSVMEYHTKESDLQPSLQPTVTGAAAVSDKASDVGSTAASSSKVDSKAFPFSITAGVEKGAKNR